MAAGPGPSRAQGPLRRNRGVARRVRQLRSRLSLNAIVRIALSRPYTFIVMAVMIMIFGIMAALRTPTDIFPEIRVPVIGVAFNFAGLPPSEMSDRIVTQFERFASTTVDDVEHMESQSVNGIGIIKIFFQPGVDIRTATAQVV